MLINTIHGGVSMHNNNLRNNDEKLLWFHFTMTYFVKRGLGREALTGCKFQSKLMIENLINTISQDYALINKFSVEF